MRLNNKLILSHTLLVLAITILFSTSVFSLNDIHFKLGGNDIEYFQETTISMVDIGLEAPSDFQFFTVNLSQAGIKEEVTFSKDHNSCSQEGNRIICWFKQTIQFQSSTPKFTGTITVNEQEQNFEITKTLKVDNIPPIIKRIRTNYCDDSNCYVSPNLQLNTVYLDIEETGSGFSKKNIFLDYLGRKVGVSSCEPGWTCKVNLEIPESIGSRLTVSVIPYLNTLSSDDAGNEIGGIKQVDFVVDRVKPEITSSNIIVTSSSGLETFTTSDTLTFTMNVTERETRPHISIFSSGFESRANGTCVEKRNYWECKVSTRASTEVTREDDFQITVRDTAGNTVSKTKSVKVHTVSTTSKPEHWQLKSSQSSPSLINKNNLIMGRSIYVSIELEPISNAKIVGVKKQVQCISGGAEGSHGSDLAAPVILNPVPGEDTYVLRATLKNNGLFDQIIFVNYTCYIDVLSMKDDVVEKNYESIPVSFRINFDRKSRVDGALAKKLNNSIREQEELQRKIDGWMGQIRNVKLICDLVMGKLSLSSRLAMGEAAASGKEPVTANLMGQLSQFSFEGADMLKQFCGYLTCNSSILAWKDKLVDPVLGESELMGYLDSTAKFVGYNDFASTMSPYKSKYIAYGTLCLPAILYHMEAELAIKCQYTGCLSRMATLGLSVEPCEQSNSYATCLKETGDWLYAIPGTAMMSEFGSILEDITRDPWGFAAIGVTSLVCGSADGLSKFTGKIVSNLFNKPDPTGVVNLLHSSCVLINTATQVTALFPLAQQVFSFGTPSVSSECDAIMDRMDLDKMTWDMRRTVVSGSPSIPPLSQEDIRVGNTDLKADFDLVNGIYIEEFGVRAIPYYTIGEDKTIDTSSVKNYQLFHVDKDGVSHYWGDTDSLNQQFKNSVNNLKKPKNSIKDGDSEEDKIEPIDPTKPHAENIFDKDYTPVGAKETIIEIEGEDPIISFDSRLSETPANLFIEKGLMDKDGNIDTEKLGLLNEVLVEGIKQYNLQIARFEGNPEMTNYISSLNNLKDTRKEAIKDIQEVQIVKQNFNEEIEKIDKEIASLEPEILDPPPSDQQAREQKIIKLKQERENLEEKVDKKDKELKEINKKIKDAEKQAKSDYKKVATRNAYDALFAGDNFGEKTVKTFSFTLRLGKSVSMLRSAIQQEEFTSKSTMLSEFFHDKFSAVEETICSDKVLENNNVKGTAMFSSASGQTPAVSIYASKSEQLVNNNYEYFIGLSVINPKHDGLRFEVEVGGETINPQCGIYCAEGSETIVELDKGSSFDRSLSEMIFYESDKNHNLVCVKFLNSKSELNKYFDKYDLPNNKLCQKIISESTG